MSYQPPAYDAVSPDSSDDPYVPPEYDAVDFGDAAGLKIAAPVTQLDLTNLQSVISGAGTIALNAPRTDMSLTGELADPTGAGAVDLSAPTTPLALSPQDTNAFTPRANNTPRADEWLVEIDHPDTGRTLSPAVLDEPEITPSLNSTAEVRIPVRREPEFLDPAFDSDPEMRVWRNGERQPIEELRQVEQTPERSVLVGVGGVDLENRVVTSFDNERRHLAAEQLITTETTYQADVDTPDVETRTDQRVADYSVAQELDENSRTQPTDPIFFDLGQARLAQVCFNQTVDDIQADGDFVVQSVQTGTSNTVDGDLFILDDPGNHFVEFTIDLKYDIPPEDSTTRVGGLVTRMHAEHTGNSALDAGTFAVSIDGSDSGVRVTVDEADQFEWTLIGSEDKLESGLEAGTHTIRYTLDSVETSGTQFLVDNIAIYDDRFGPDLDFPDTVDANLQLAGPQLFPEEYLLEFPEDFRTPFAFVAADIFVDMNDTSGNQFIEASLDRGQTFDRVSNSEDFETSFPSGSSTLRFRVNLSRYGSRTNETPTEGFLGQRIEFIFVDVDIELAFLLINEDFDRDLLSILNEIATEDEFIWSFRIVDGEPTISFTQPGTRIADRDPEIGDVQVSKDSTTFPRVTVKGSPQPVSGESFTASTSFEPLNNEPILNGSESVIDPDTGEQFDRFVDYELDRQNGEIRVFDGGDMTIGESYEISYRFEIKTTITSDEAPTDPRHLVREVPGVSTDRQAEQIARLLVREFEDPSYAADLTIPDPDLNFNPIEAFSLANLDLPDAAGALEVRGAPQQTPRGLRVRLGSRPEIEREISQLATQLQKVAERS